MLLVQQYSYEPEQEQGESYIYLRHAALRLMRHRERDNSIMFHYHLARMGVLVMIPKRIKSSINGVPVVNTMYLNRYKVRSAPSRISAK